MGQMCDLPNVSVQVSVGSKATLAMSTRLTLGTFEPQMRNDSPSARPSQKILRD